MVKRQLGETAIFSGMPFIDGLSYLAPENIGVGKVLPSRMRKFSAAQLSVTLTGYMNQLRKVALVCIEAQSKSGKQGAA